MPKGDRYGALTDYLISAGNEQISLSFDEVANIVGGLPSSAYQYQAWWSNGGHVHSGSWMGAGFKTSLDMARQRVTFCKSNAERIIVARSLPNQRAGVQTIKRKSTSSTLDIHVALESIRRYYRTTVEGEHTRYRSWEHCYKAFRENRNEPEKEDFLCLHLAVYLASWGMLRNSFLLNRDYLVHMPVIKALTSGRYEQLFTSNSTPAEIPLVLQAADDIQKAYLNNAVSNTLITKILLGVFGCAPAYDRYFRDSARKYKVCGAEWNSSSLHALWDYYQEHADLLDALRRDILTNGLIYPPMKLIDMCLWQLGFDADSDVKEVIEEEA